MGRNTLPFISEVAARIPPRLPPRDWLSPPCLPLQSQVRLPLIITEHFILDTVNADRELTVPLAAASSEGAQVRLPGHVL